MTQQLLERTAREWVFCNPARGARDLARLAGPDTSGLPHSTDEIADALIELAGRLDIGRNRVW